MPHTQTFGHRSLLFKLVLTLIAWILAGWFLGLLGFLMAFITTLVMNMDAVDAMKVTLDDEILHVTRYIPLTKYDCKFYLKDIKEAGIYLKKKFGKSQRADGGKGGYTQTWYQLHIILHDGREQEVQLLSMEKFEREFLKQALKEKGIPHFEIAYRWTGKRGNY